MLFAIAAALWIVTATIWVRAYRTTYEPLFLAIAVVSALSAAANGFAAYLHLVA